MLLIDLYICSRNLIFLSWIFAILFGLTKISGNGFSVVFLIGTVVSLLTMMLSGIIYNVKSQIQLVKSVEEREKSLEDIGIHNNLKDEVLSTKVVGKNLHRTIALIFNITLGFFGLHNIYVGKIVKGFVQMAVGFFSLMFIGIFPKIGYSAIILHILFIMYEQIKIVMGNFTDMDGDKIEDW